MFSLIVYDKFLFMVLRTMIYDNTQSEKPEFILGEYNAFIFDVDDNEKSKIMKEHTATSEEICELVKDLRLLAKSDFRRLLKWRLKMIKYFASLDKSNDDEDENDDDDKDKNREYTQEELENLADEEL